MRSILEPEAEVDGFASEIEAFGADDEASGPEESFGTPPEVELVPSKEFEPEGPRGVARS